MRKKLNKKFEDMLTLASKPFAKEGKKSEEKRPDDYSGKKTHPHTPANASGKHNDKSR